MGATFDALGSGESATITIYVRPRGERGRFAPRTNVGRVRVPPRRYTASPPGEFHVPMWARRPTEWVRIVASDGFDLRAYEGVTRPTPMRRSLLLLATDFAPRADVGAASVLDSLFRRPNQERSVL